MEADRLVVTSHEAGSAVQVLRASGQLGLATVAVLRAGAQNALAHQPDLLVIDLSGVVLRDRAAARVLSLIAAQASVWPVARVAVAGAAPEIERASRRSIGLCPPMWVADSAALVADRTRPVVARRSLPQDLSAARTARQVVAATCPDDLVREQAEIVVTELVGNAVRYARGPLELRIVYTGRVHISLRDDTPHLPRAEDGYGLDVVRRFALVWGWGPVPGGKVVWAVAGPVPQSHRSIRLTCAR